MRLKIQKGWKEFWEKLSTWKLTREKTENLNNPTSVGGAIYKSSYTENSQTGPLENSSKYLKTK